MLGIFRPRQNRQRLDLAFNISNFSIDRVKEVTFLGVILDEQLTWKSNIQGKCLKHILCTSNYSIDHIIKRFHEENSMMKRLFS